MLLISVASATDNITGNTTDDNLLTVPDEEITTEISTATPEQELSEEEDTLNPDVTIYCEDNLIGFEAPEEVFDDLDVWINNVNYGSACDLNNKYGIIKQVQVKNNKGEVVAIKNMTWNHLKFTLNKKKVTLTGSDYQLLKQHKTIKKYVGIEKIKYISKYKKVNKKYYKTKLLAKAYRSVIGVLLLSKIIGVKNTIKYLKSVNKKLNKKVKNQINKMKKKGWKFDYTYKTSKNGLYKLYGEFHKVKKVKVPVYKYKKVKNYMKFKFSSGKYVVSVDSDDGKYVYSKSFRLI